MVKGMAKEVSRVVDGTAEVGARQRAGHRVEQEPGTPAQQKLHLERGARAGEQVLRGRGPAPTARSPAPSPGSTFSAVPAADSAHRPLSPPPRPGSKNRSAFSQRGHGPVRASCDSESAGLSAGQGNPWRAPCPGTCGPR